MTNLTLMIGTCDSYKILWDNFVTLCDRYWGVDCKKIFVSENSLCEYNGYDWHLAGNHAWSSRMLSALNMIDTEYTFFVLEDYYFTELLTYDELQLHIDFMSSVNANKIMLETNNGYSVTKYSTDSKGRDIVRLSPYSDYLTSIQPSIWKTSHLKKCMCTDWSPWDFEIKGTNLIRGTEYDTYMIVRDKKPYWNAVRKGMKLSPGWSELMNKEQLAELQI